MWLKKIVTSRWLPWSISLGLAVFAMHSQGEMNWERISRQNAEAALDSTRSISTRHGDVFARIIAQKDVQFAGALAEASEYRRLHPKLAVSVVVRGGTLDTSTTHTVPTGVGDRHADGLQPSNAVHAGPDGARSDSLVLAGPPVRGVVSVAVRDSTFFWAAHLRPSPIPLEIGLGCGKNGPEILAHGPSWVETEISPGTVDPKVCNPPGSKFWTGVKYGIGTTAGITALVVIGRLFHLF
jgi:hypothetical protein